MPPIAETVHAATEPRRKMLNDFCEVLFACRYKPEECLHETHMGANGVIRDVLKVRGISVFEVTTEQRIETDDSGCRIVFRFTPRLIEWPLGYPVAKQSGSSNTPEPPESR